MFRIEEKHGLKLGRFNELNTEGFISAVSLRSSDKDPFNLALHTGDNRAKVVENRGSYLKALGADPGRLSCLNQIHSDKIEVIGPAEAGRGAFNHVQTVDADGLLTDQPGIPLMIFTADCVPFILYEPSARIAGLVHAGWQGLEKKILQKAVRLAVDRFNIDPKKLLIGTGPYIRSCCYAVGEEFRDKFPAKYFSIRDGKTFFDLTGSVKDDLAGLGIPSTNFFDSALCTACSPQHCHSFRRDKTVSRHATMAMIISDQR